MSGNRAAVLFTAVLLLAAVGLLSLASPGMNKYSNEHRTILSHSTVYLRETQNELISECFAGRRVVLLDAEAPICQKTKGAAAAREQQVSHSQNQLSNGEVGQGFTLLHLGPILTPEAGNAILSVLHSKFSSLTISSTNGTGMFSDV